MPEAAERRALNKRLSQIFRMRGLALRPDAMQPLYDLLHNDEDGWETVLHALLAELQPEWQQLGCRKRKTKWLDRENRKEILAYC